MIDNFSLLVGYVVIFEPVLSNVEVVGLDLALRPLDLAGQQLALYRLTLTHAGPGQ